MASHELTMILIKIIKMYCAELIDKALQKATGNRVNIKGHKYSYSNAANDFGFPK